MAHINDGYSDLDIIDCRVCHQFKLYQWLKADPTHDGGAMHGCKGQSHVCVEFEPPFRFKSVRAKIQQVYPLAFVGEDEEDGDEDGIF